MVLVGHTLADPYMMALLRTSLLTGSPSQKMTESGATMQ